MSCFSNLLDTRLGLHGSFIQSFDTCVFGAHHAPGPPLGTGPAVWRRTDSVSRGDGLGFRGTLFGKRGPGPLHFPWIHRFLWGLCPSLLVCKTDLWAEMKQFERENRCRLEPQSTTIRKRSLPFRGLSYSRGKS